MNSKRTFEIGTSMQSETKQILRKSSTLTSIAFVLGLMCLGISIVLGESLTPSFVLHQDWGGPTGWVEVWTVFAIFGFSAMIPLILASGFLLCRASGGRFSPFLYLAFVLPSLILLTLNFSWIGFDLGDLKTLLSGLMYISLSHAAFFITGFYCQRLLTIVASGRSY